MAVNISGSACDECARNGIIENEGGRCTVCGEVANPEELIPYRLFRDKVSEPGKAIKDGDDCLSAG